MQPALSYHFGEIEFTVRQQIHATSARMNTSLEELRHLVAPLQQTFLDVNDRLVIEVFRFDEYAVERSDAAA